MTLEQLIDNQRAEGRYLSIGVFTNKETGQYQVIADQEPRVLNNLPGIFTSIYSIVEGCLTETVQGEFEKWFKEVFEKALEERYDIEPRTIPLQK